MNNNTDKKETFTYTYSAATQEKVNKIRKKYLPPEEDKMERLYRLDKSVTDKACIAALVLGISGALIMGTGMCFIMTELSEFFGNFSMVIGIITGVLGMVLACLAYPVYNMVLKKERERIAPEILRLSDEILKKQ